MDNNINKEQWIDQVIDSTKGMSRARPASGLFEKISSRLSVTPVVKTLPMPLKQWTAAAIILLALNVGSILHVTNNNKVRHIITGNPFSVDMQSVPTYNY